MHKVIHVFPGGNHDTFALNLVTHSSQNLKLVLYFINPLPQSFLHSLAENKVDFTSFLKYFRNTTLNTFTKSFRLVLDILFLRPKTIFLHGPSAGLLGFFSLLLTLRRSRYVFVRHHNQMNRILNVRKAILLDRFLIRFFSRFIAVDNAVKQSMIFEGCAAERITVIPNGVCLDNFPVIKYEDRTPDAGKAELKILMIGRLAPEKNYELAIDVFSRLESLRVNFVTLVLGEGTLKKHLSKLAKESLANPNSFKLVGHVNDLTSYFKQGDLLLHLSIDEACPLSLIESLASGLPVLALPKGGIRNVVPQRFWLLEQDALSISEDLAAISSGARTLRPMRMQPLNHFRDYYSAKRMARDYDNYVMNFM